jgi:hypothetical protein
VLSLSGEKFFGRNPRFTEIKTTFFLSFSKDDALVAARTSGATDKPAEGRKSARKADLVKVRLLMIR